MRWAVLLAGGSGTRFWPLSTPARPKQVLRLAGAGSPAEEAVGRLQGLVERDRILLVTGPELVAPLQDQLQLPPANVLVEPRPRSTGPALAWASHEAARRDADAVVLSLHADWHVPEPEDFRRAARLALDLAEQEPVLVTVGVVPTRPETGYGYILPGPAIASRVARPVERFTEKPPGPVAEELIARGALWNSGLFAWQASVFLEEVRAHSPEIAGAMPWLDRGDAERFFGEVHEIAVDVGVLERSARIAVVPGDFAWDDIGTWEALARVRPCDGNGNVTAGPVIPVDAANNIVWTEDTPVVLAGVSGLVVVHANGRILVMDRSRAADLKRVLDGLPSGVRQL